MSQTDKRVNVPANRWTEVEVGNFKPGNVYVEVVSGSFGPIGWKRHFCHPPFYLDGQFTRRNTFPFLLCPWENLVLFSPSEVTVRVTSSA